MPAYTKVILTGVLIFSLTLAGCSGIFDGDQPLTPAQNQSGATPSAPPSGGDSTPPSGADGTSTTSTPSSAERELAGVLSNLGVQERTAIQRMAQQDGRFDEADISIAQLLVNSSDQYREAVTTEVPQDGEWDEDGDGLLTGAELNLYGTDPSKADRELGEIRSMLVEDQQLPAQDIDYLRFLSHNEYTRQSPHGRWMQLERVGLLYDIAEDGAVTRSEMKQYANDDSDILINEMEHDIGTNPQSADTDYDRFTDGQEVYLTSKLPDAHPTVKDVYIEVDKMQYEGWLDDDVKEQIKNDFSTSPVDNGSGIHVRFVEDDVVPRNRIRVDSSQPGEHDDLVDYYEKHFNRSHQGYYYLLLTEQFGFSQFGGITYPSAQYMIVEHGHPVWEGQTTEHELGHAIANFTHEDFRGVDSRDISYEDYPSVMNYNVREEGFGFSDGGHSENDFDDWKYIEENFGEPRREVFWNPPALEFGNRTSQ